MKKEQTMGLLREILTATGGLAFAGFTGWPSVVGLILAVAMVIWGFIYNEGAEAIYTGIRKVLSLAPALAVELGWIGIDQGASITALILPFSAMIWSYISKGNSTPNVPINLFILMFALILSLASCSDYPVQGSLVYRDPGSGAKGGVTFVPGAKPIAFIKVPLIDPETGEVIGYADLQAPIEIEPSK